MKALAAKQSSNDAIRKHKGKVQTPPPSTAKASVFSYRDIAIQRKPTCPCGGGCPGCEELPIQTNFETGLRGNLQAKTEASQNKTGIPDNLKSGLENLSSMNLSSVRVHHNSSKPAQLNALAYTQGQNIHVAPGQEKHLPHEGWHAVQQMQGRVTPTMQAKGVSINDYVGLEREADVMGEKALKMTRAEQVTTGSVHLGSTPVQSDDLQTSEKPAEKKAKCERGSALRWGCDTVCSHNGFIDKSISTDEECCNKWPPFVEQYSRNSLNLNGVASCRGAENRRKNRIATVTYEGSSIKVLCTDAFSKKRNHLIELSPSAMMDLKGNMENIWRGKEVEVCYEDSSIKTCLEPRGVSSNKEQKCVSKECQASLKGQKRKICKNFGWPKV